MATIPLNDHYRIASDELCWRLERRRTRRDKGTGELGSAWEPLSFHGTIGQAATEFLQRGLRLSNATGIAELRADLESLVTALSLAFPDCFEPELLERINAHGKALREAAA